MLPWTPPLPHEAPLEPAPYGPLPVGSGRQVWARRPADEAEAKAIASPLRLRILRITLHEPHTNKEIAEALGSNPASVLHHVRTLVDTGFLIEQSVRRGPRGSRERPYLASGKSWYVDTGEVDMDRRTGPAPRDVPPGDQGTPSRGPGKHAARLPVEGRGPTTRLPPASGCPPGDRGHAERSRRGTVEHLSRPAPRHLRRTVLP